MVALMTMNVPSIFTIVILWLHAKIPMVLMIVFAMKVFQGMVMIVKTSMNV